MKKRITAIVLVLAFVFSFSPAYASSTFGIEVSSTGTATEGIYTVAVSLVNNPGISNGDITITYDADILSLVEVSKGAIFDVFEGYFFGNVSTGKVTFGGDSNFKENGVLFTMLFEAKEGAVNGEYEVGLTVKNFTNVNREPKLPTATSGFVTVTGGIDPSLVKPTITAHPADVTATYPATPASMTVEAQLPDEEYYDEGTELTYQWYITSPGSTERTRIEGATAKTLLFASVDLVPNNTALYTVTCDVGSTYRDKNYTQTAMAYLKYEKGSLTSVELKGSPFTYDGEQKTVTVEVKDQLGNVVDPEYYDVTGLLFATNDGEYTVNVAATADAPYIGTPQQTWRIDPADLTFTGDESLTIYINGQAYPLNLSATDVKGQKVVPTWSVGEGSEEKIALDTAGEVPTVTAKDLGYATVQAEYTAENHNSVTKTITILVSDKKNATVTLSTTDDTYTYDKDTTYTLGNLITVESATDGEGNSLNDGTYKWSVKRSTLEGVDIETIEDVDPTEYEFSDAGRYNITVTYEDSTYRGEAYANFVIEKAAIDVSSLRWDYFNLETRPIVYDGNEHTVSLTGDEGVLAMLNIKYDGNFATDSCAKAGVVEYVATATVAPKDADNYKIKGNVTNCNWTIAPHEIHVTDVTWTADSFEYDGSEKKVELTNIPVGITVTYEEGSNVATNVKDYQATAIFASEDANYKPSISSQTHPWSITKKSLASISTSASVRYSDTSNKTFTADNIKTLIGDTNPDTTITILSADANTGSVVTAGVADGAVTYKLNGDLTADDTGKTATIAVSYSSNNYENGTVDLTVNVIDKEVVDSQLVFEGGSVTYTGQEQSWETATLVEGSTLDVENITYSYSGDRTNVGSFTVTATYEDNENRGTATATVNITPASLTVTDATVEDKEYDGDAVATVNSVTFDGLIPGETLTKGEDYTVTGQFDSANVGEQDVTVTVTLTESAKAKNYNLPTASIKVTAAITAEPIEVTIEPIANQTYTGSAIVPTVVVKNDGTVIDPSEYTVTCDNNTYVGTASVQVASKSGANQTFAQSATFNVVADARTLETTTTAEAPASVVRGGTLDLRNLVSSNTGSVENVTFATSDTNVEIDGYTLTASETTGDVTVTATASEYDVNNDGKPEYTGEATVTVYVTVVDKSDADVTISGMPETLTYGDTFTLIATAGNTGDNGEWNWSTTNSEVFRIVDNEDGTADVTVIGIVDATITATYESATTLGNDTTASVTPGKAEIVIKAEDVTIYVGEEAPAVETLTCTVTGLKFEDALIIEPTLAYDLEEGAEIDTSKTGKYTIKAGQAEASNVYTISYEDGTLEIVKKPVTPVEPVEPVIPTYSVNTGVSFVGASFAVSNAAPKLGELLTVNVEVEPMYKLVDVIINGQSHGATTEISFIVTADVDIVVVTERIPSFFEEDDAFADSSTNAADRGSIDYSKYLPSYTDVLPANWFYNNVAWAWSRNLLDNTWKFEPNANATRATIVEWIWRMEGRPVVYGAPFTDTTSMSAAWASANGIVNGYGNGKFGPDDLVTREQLAAILYRYAQYKGVNTASRGNLSKFSDAGKVSAWATESMQWAVGVGMINGYTDGSVKPQGNATRAELTALLNRMSVWYGI